MNFSLLNSQGLVTKYTNKLLSTESTQIFQNNDIILLTETWSGELTDISVNGFNVFQLDRGNKKLNTKRNSGGIALYIKSDIINYCSLIEKDSDDILWLKINGSLFNLTYDFYLCLCYIIPSGSSREPVTEVSVLDRISDFIVKIAHDTHNCYNILICADFNSRTGTENDFVVFDNNANMGVLLDDYLIDEFLTRFSQDHVINSNGRKLLDFCRLNGLRICNGRIGSDSGVGKYTYVGSTGSSVVDYVITNPSLLDFIHKFDIGEPNILSDHYAVQFSIYRDREPTNAFQTGEMPHEILNKNMSGMKQKQTSIYAI